MSTRVIGRAIEDKIHEIYPDGDWYRVYDEAETWWANEMLDAFNESWHPTHKSAHDKEGGLSLIKDVLNSDLLQISDACPKLFWEMDNYYKDKRARFPRQTTTLSTRCGTPCMRPTTP